MQDMVNTSEVDDPRVLLLQAPMSGFQWRAVATIIALCALDGFDVFSMTFAAPAVLRDWGIDKAQLGIALSAGLLGMAAGSLFLSPLADTLGRRRVMFAALAIMVLGTGWTAVAADMSSLTLSRVFTGLGIGAMIGVIMPLAAEYANASRRDRAVALFGLGFPAGGILGGLVAAYLLAHFGWRGIFVAASVFGIALGAVAYWTLLEPVALVIAKPGANALAEVNNYLSKCGHPPVERLPAPPENRKVPIRRLFEPGMASVTIMVTLIYFLVVIPVFFMQTWLPTLIADLGILPAKAALISAFFSLGGVTAGIAIAWLVVRWGLRALLNIALIGSAVMIIGFSLLPADPIKLVIAAAIAGLFVQGSMIALYAVVARTFPAEMRASGSGFVVGIGRIGSILPPMLAGGLAVAGFSRSGIALTMAVPALVAMALLTRFVIRSPTTA